MKTVKTFSFILYFHSLLFAQPQQGIEWQKCLGGIGVDVSNSIYQTIDGGYIVSGYSTSNNGDVSGNHGGDDFWVVKIDSAGNLQWQKCLGGTGSDVSNSIYQTNDGGYMVSGCSTSNDGDVSGNHGGNDYWVVKIDSTGNLQWQKCLGGTGIDRANSIYQTNDGGYIVSGYSASNDGDVSGYHGGIDYWVVKIDNAGNLQWQKCLGGSGLDVSNSIYQTYDGGYIVSGYSTSNDGDVSGNHGGNDYWVVKIDSAGNLQWQKSLGGTGGDVSNSIYQTNDGGYIVSGYSASNDGDVSGNHGGNDYWVVKLDSAGNLQWQKSLGGTSVDRANSIYQTNDGGYIVSGCSSSNDGDVSGSHGGGDFWVVKLDSSGNLQEHKCFGGSSADADLASALFSTNDAGFIFTCNSVSNNGDVTGNHGGDDFWVVKHSPCFINNTNPYYVCIVTIDSVSGFNQIIWEKPAIRQYTDSFIVYKETSLSGNYSKVGAVNVNDFSVFIDSSSNPQQRADRYYITVSDECGGESPPSSSHKTIHLSINQGVGSTYNLIWDQYEGFNYGTYYILRGTTPNNLITIDSVQSTLQSYTDLNPPVGAVYYAVEVRKPTSCNPTARTCSVAYSSSRSNLKSNMVTSVPLNSPFLGLQVYPSPASDNLVIDCGTNYTGLNGYSIRITNLLGQTVYNSPVTAQITNIQLTPPTWVNGTYVVQFINPQGTVLDTKRVIIQ